MGPAQLVDLALEVSIVGSFGRPGYRLRRRLFGWPDPDPGSMTGQTVVLTGPTSGLGRSAAGGLAALGARIVLLGRDESRLQRVAHELRQQHGRDEFPIVVVDMASLASVRAAVAAIGVSESRIDVVVDSAGAINEERVITDDGLEATFATMVVGPYVLIDGLLPQLEQSGGGRVISVVSGGMYAQALDLDDLQFEDGPFDGVRAYARAKRASTVMVREWARRLRGRRVRVDAMHPGWVDTPGLARSLPRFYDVVRPILRTPEEGVDTIVWLAAQAPRQAAGGRLFLDRRPRPFDRVPSTRVGAAERRRLWDLVVAASHGPF